MSEHGPRQQELEEGARPVSAPNARVDQVLAADLWLADRICQHAGIREAYFLGCLDDPAARRERLRKAILENGLSTVGLGSHAGKFETYSAHFERRFGEAL